MSDEVVKQLVSECWALTDDEDDDDDDHDQGQVLFSCVFRRGTSCRQASLLQSATSTQQLLSDNQPIDFFPDFYKRPLLSAPCLIRLCVRATDGVCLSTARLLYITVASSDA